MPLTALPPAAPAAQDDYALLAEGLALVESDPASRQKCAEALLRLGLSGPARELTDEIAALAERAAGGSLNWDALRAQFDANFAVLAQRNPDFPVSRDELLKPLAALQLSQSCDGNYHLSRRVGRGPRRWLPGLVNWRRIARRPDLVPHDPNMLCVPYAIEGVAFGDVIEYVYAATRTLLVGYRARMHLFESNAAQLAAWLHVRDLRELLADERVRVWFGRAGLQGFLAFHLENPGAQAPAFVIYQPGWGASQMPVVQPVLEGLTRHRAAEQAQHVQRIRSNTRGRDAGYYARRFRERATRPLRILGITSRFTTFLQYSMRDLQQTAEARGHQFRVQIEADEFTPIMPDHVKAAQMAEFDPDLLLIIDHNRREYGPTFDFPVPFINWLQDDLPHLFEPGTPKLGPLDLAVGYITPAVARRAGYPTRQCCYMQIPVNPRVYDATPVSRAALERARCEVSFVSHLSLTPEEYLRRAVASEPGAQRRRLMQALFETLTARITDGAVPASAAQIFGITQGLAHEIGFEISEAEANGLRRGFTERLINLIFRQQPLVWAAELGLDLNVYGTGWEQHPRLARFARGAAGNGEHLRTIFQASTINLQIYPLPGIHQRLLEGLSSGGFFLIRGTPFDEVCALYRSVVQRCSAEGIRDEAELANSANGQLQQDVRRLHDVLIAPRKPYGGFVQELHDHVEVLHAYVMPEALPRYAEVAFRTRADFERQVKYWLAHEDERREIAAAQRARVLERFTYDAFFERTLNFAAEYFERCALEGVAQKGSQRA